MKSGNPVHFWLHRCLAVVGAALVATLAIVLTADAADSTGVVTKYVFSNPAGGLTDNVPATFGAVFAKGDVPATSSVVASDASGNSLPVQVDVKARHPDGSLRHAVVTVVVPHLAGGQDLSVILSRGVAAQAPALPLSDLPSDFDTIVTLSMKDGRQLSASAKALLAAAKPELWLSGSQVTEWWVAGPLHDAQGRADDHLSVRFGIRSYGKGRPLRVEADVENTWIWVPGRRTEFFDAQITANGKSILTQPGMSQQAQTRWRKIFWWNSSSDVFVKQNLDYLKKARVISNYNPRANVSESDVARYYASFQSKDRRPLETGIITHYMPMTGGRGDIGPLPRWTVYYLLTMDRRAYQMMLVSGDLGGSFMSHYRNEKTGRPGTSEEFPKISTHSNLVGQPGNLEIPDYGGRKWDIVAQSAHEPSLAFLPYLVTGDRYYLEELQFWSQWNSWGTAPERHGFAKNLVGWDEVRGQAWSLRTLAEAAFVTPDNDPMKATLARELAANLAYYNDKYSNGRTTNVFHALLDQPSAERQYSPWMDDFLTWSAGYVAQLGFDAATPFAKWKGHYPVQRMINPGYCWILATSYRMIYENPDRSPVTNWSEAYRLTLAFEAKKPVDTAGLQCGSDEMANALDLRPGKMLTSNDPGGYPANLQPALAAAVDADVPEAKAAWDKFQAAHNPIEPAWDILPWSDEIVR